MRWKSSPPRAARLASSSRQAIARAISSSGAATSPSSATACRARANGWPTPPWKNGLPRGADHEAPGHAVPAPLALLYRHQARGDRARCSPRPVLFWIVVTMARERLYLFDTTLRDGAQTNGVDFTLHDKLVIAAMLDDLGIDYVEGGYPGANPTDTELFAQDRKLAATFTAFGMTRRPGRSTSNDPGLAALLEARADA